MIAELLNVSASQPCVTSGSCGKVKSDVRFSIINQTGTAVPKINPITMSCDKIFKRMT